MIAAKLKQCAGDNDVQIIGLLVQINARNIYCFL